MHRLIGLRAAGILRANAGINPSWMTGGFDVPCAQRLAYLLPAGFGAARYRQSHERGQYP